MLLLRLLDVLQPVDGVTAPHQGRVQVVCPDEVHKGPEVLAVGGAGSLPGGGGREAGVGSPVAGGAGIDSPWAGQAVDGARGVRQEESAHPQGLGQPDGEAQDRGMRCDPRANSTALRSGPCRPSASSLLRPAGATRLGHRPLRVTSRSCLERRKTARPGIIPRTVLIPAAARLWA